MSEEVLLKAIKSSPPGTGALADDKIAHSNMDTWWQNVQQHDRDSPTEQQDPSCSPPRQQSDANKGGVDSNNITGLKAGTFLATRSGTPAKKNSPRLDTLRAGGDSEPRVWLPSCGKHFTSISQAVANAARDEEIIVKPGLYQEGSEILLDKPNVTLRAEDGGQVVIVLASKTKSKTAQIICRANGVKLIGILLHRTGTLQKDENPEIVNHASGSCVVVESGNVCIEGCTLKSQTGPGIFVCSDSRPTLSNCILTENHTAAIVCGGRSYTTMSSCSIKRNAGFGLWLLDHSDGMFTNCKIGGNSKCGVLCCGKSKGTFDHNKVANGGQGGFWMQGETRTVITNNVILKNHRAAMQVGDNADPIVAHNQILEGDGGGIVVHDKARGLFFCNELSGSCRAGAGVMDSASPLFMGNNMTKNNGGGAVVAGSSTPSFIGNNFINNGFVGVGMKETSKVLMQGNTVTGTVGYGVLMQGSSKLHLQDTRLEQNEQSGVCACDDTQLKAYGCTITAGTDQSGQQCGISLHGNARMYVETATISGHVAGNVVFNEKSSGTITESNISGSRSSGVTLQGSASVRLFRNVIAGNRVSNVLVLDDTSLVAEWNSIMEAAGCGIRTMGGSKCIINHNTIMSNHETGVVCSGKMQLDMKLNRVSQNGKDGVYVDGAEAARVIDNAIFDNASSGLRLKNVLNMTVTGNLLLSSTNKQASNSTSLVFRGKIGGQISDNVLHAKPGLIAAGDALHSLLQANVPCTTQKHAADAVTLCLSSLHYLEQKRDAVTLVQMPDGSTSVAQRCLDKLKRRQEASLSPESVSKSFDDGKLPDGTVHVSSPQAAPCVVAPITAVEPLNSASPQLLLRPQVFEGSPTPVEQPMSIQPPSSSLSEPLMSSPVGALTTAMRRLSAANVSSARRSSSVSLGEYDSPRVVLEEAMRRRMEISRSQSGGQSQASSPP